MILLVVTSVRRKEDNKPRPVISRALGVPRLLRPLVKLLAAWGTRDLPDQPAKRLVVEATSCATRAMAPYCGIADDQSAHVELLCSTPTTSDESSYPEGL